MKTSALILCVLGLSLSGVAFGQVGGSKGTARKFPISVRDGTGQKKSALTKVYGTVVRDGVKKSVISIGMPNHGRIEVETKSAMIRGKDGRIISLTKISAGSNISATGRMGAKKFLAKEVTVNYIRPLGAFKPKFKSVVKKGR